MTTVTKEMTINLLPPERQQTLQRTIGQRLLLFYGKIALIFVSLFVGELIALLVAVRIEVRALAENTAFRHEQEEFQALTQTVDRFKKTLAVAETFIVRTEPVTAWLETIVTRLPPELRLQRLYVSRKDRSVALTGRSPLRETLLEFETALKQNERVATVDIPLTSLLQARDFDFLMTITFKE